MSYWHLMNSGHVSSEEMAAYIRRLENPYAKLSLLGVEEETAEPTFEQKQAYFKGLQDPHAFDSIFGDPEDYAESVVKELDNVLNMYKPFVARNEWSRVVEYRANFLKRATETTARASRTISRLQKFKFQLPSDEKVEFNRAPAARIISELEKILT